MALTILQGDGVLKLIKVVQVVSAVRVHPSTMA
jgi:hypothetical protein